MNNQHSSNSSTQNLEWINQALSCLPPKIADSMLKRESFVRYHQIPVSPNVNLSRINASFNQELLYDGIREVFSRMKPQKQIIDTESNTWTLLLDKSLNLDQLALKSENGKIYSLPNFLPISPKRENRKNYFKQLTKDGYITREFAESWRKILEQRALNYDEYWKFYSELRISPTFYLNDIKDYIRYQYLEPKRMVPNSRAYFEQLIGKFDGSNSISDYATNEARSHITNLIDWQMEEGYKFCLRLSMHSSMKAEVAKKQVESKEFKKTLESLISGGDRTSQLGAITVGLTKLSQLPEVEPLIFELVKQILNDDLEDEHGGFNLLSMLYVLIDGEIARTKIFYDSPPFYRRFASLTHASCLQEILSTVTSDSKSKFSDWVMKLRGQHYYFRNFSEMHFDPRWCAEFTTGKFFKNYFVHQIIRSIELVGVQNISNQFQNLLTNSSANVLKFKKFNSTDALASPLDGTEFCEKITPKEILDSITKSLEPEYNKRFNTRFLWERINKYTDLQKKDEFIEVLLKQYHLLLEDLNDENELFEVMLDLANITAIAGSTKLANHYKLFCQQYRSFHNSQWSDSYELQCCLISSTAIQDDQSRLQFVGTWVTELSHCSTSENISMLLSCIFHLCQVEPKFWKYCSRADAILSFCHSQDKSESP